MDKQHVFMLCVTVLHKASLCLTGSLFTWDWGEHSSYLHTVPHSWLEVVDRLTPRAFQVSSHNQSFHSRLRLAPRAFQLRHRSWTNWSIYVDYSVLQRTSLIQSPLQVIHLSQWHLLFVCRYGQLPKSRCGPAVFLCVQFSWHAFRL